MKKPDTYPRSQPYNCAHCGKFGFRLVGYKSINTLPFCNDECRQNRRKRFDRQRSKLLKEQHASGEWKHKASLGKKKPRRDINSIPHPTEYELRNL